MQKGWLVNVYFCLAPEMKKNQLPNVLTCLNLLCGCVGIISVFHGNVIMLGGMVFLAALFDFMDGFTARSLNVHSNLGKNLDSLADMVTFGVVPGMILYNLFLKQPEQSFLGSFSLFHIFKYVPFVFTGIARSRGRAFRHLIAADHPVRSVPPGFAHHQPLPDHPAQRRAFGPDGS
jgi:phosphatidylglycerophosphate synthase